MSAQLEIRDGTPWWLSPDLWVVPGDDPSGAAGSPIAGQNNYLWARVRNTGDRAVSMARVDFFWSNPATGVLRSTSQQIGSSFTDLAPGETKEVLCVSPWVPVIVNGGHECVVAQLVHPADPLPTPLPDPFDPPAYRQVAQRNLAVVVMSRKLSHLVLPIQLSTPAQSRQRELFVRIEREPAELSKEVLANIGMKQAPSGEAYLEAGFVESRACESQQGSPEVRLPALPGRQQAVFLQLSAPQPFEGYTLVHVVERGPDEKELGGITYLVTFAKEG